MPNENDISVVTSNQFTLNWRDLLKGLLVAVIGAALTAIQTSISAGEVKFDWKSIGIVALTAGVAYLLKNFFEPAKTVVQFKPPVEEKTTVTVTPPPDATKN